VGTLRFAHPTDYRQRQSNHSMSTLCDYVHGPCAALFWSWG